MIGLSTASKSSVVAIAERVRIAGWIEDSSSRVGGSFSVRLLVRLWFDAAWVEGSGPGLGLDAAEEVGGGESSSSQELEATDWAIDLARWGVLGFEYWDGVADAVALA